MPAFKEHPSVLLVRQLVEAGWPEPVKEHRFSERERWRFDLAYPQKNVLLGIEIDGGLYIAGGHSRGAAREADMERDAVAMTMGWRVLRISPKHVRNGLAAEWVGGILTRDWKELPEEETPLSIPAALGHPPEPPEAA